MNVRSLISSAPILAAPRLGDHFQLQVDASNLSAGAALLQAGSDSTDHPVRFFCKKFNSYQLNCSIIEKVALGLIWTPQHFEVYVFGGKPLVVYTDPTLITKSKSPSDEVVLISKSLQPQHSPHQIV